MFFTLVLLGVMSLGPVASVRCVPLQASAEPTQPATERESLLREAIDHRYTVRRVEFTGNELTRHYILQRRMFLQEGDTFTRRNLMRSIANLSKLRVIYPVRLNDVWVHVERTEKLIDLTIRLRERSSHKLNAPANKTLDASRDNVFLKMLL